MSRTHFHDFLRDDGDPVTVEYEVDGHDVPTSYSPYSGADGGDVPVFCIIDAWPNTPHYNRLWMLRAEIAMPNPEGLFWKFLQHWHYFFLTVRIKWAEGRSRLTDAERERMESWLAEHHVEEPPDFEDWHR